MRADLHDDHGRNQRQRERHANDENTRESTRLPCMLLKLIELPARRTTSCRHGFRGRSRVDRRHCSGLEYEAS
jgi:hypothetical protein